ncbi:hypothetical protein TNCV_2137171 [Trichonephila clavipes]|nr:hypothetical protein TNCV_2137171 [Trichonephila clavipes]
MSIQSILDPTPDLVVRASNSRSEDQGSLPDVTKCSPNTHGVRPFNQWVRSHVGGITSPGDGEYFPPLQFHAKIVEVEIGGVAMYRPFGNFPKLNPTVTCMVLKANDWRTSCPLLR